MMIWFNVIKVEYPSSEEPPQGTPVSTLYNYVLEEDDIYYYRLFKDDSIIYIYDMHNYFLARQHTRDKRTGTFALYAEYRLTLTDEAWKVVNKLLKVPFECDVDIQQDNEVATLICTTTHKAYVPSSAPTGTPATADGKLRRGEFQAWVDIYKDDGVIAYTGFALTIPFNCGPLQPLWERAVECWARKIAVEIKQKHPAGLIGAIRRSLLERKYLHPSIIPAYSI